MWLVGRSCLWCSRQLGTIWLSGRITGGHLLTLVWHTAAFAGLFACLTRGGWPRAAALGLWCGLGLYLDAMFLFTLAGMIPAAFFAWLSTGRSRASIGPTVVFSVRACWSVSFPMKSAGVSIRTTRIPRSSTRRLNPGRSGSTPGCCVLHCLPRLVAGTEIDHLETPGLSTQSRRVGTARLSGSQIRSTARGHGEWPAFLLVTAFLIALLQDGARPG